MSNNTSPSQPKPQAQADEKPFAQELKDWIEENRGLTEIFLDAYCIVDVLSNVVDFNIAFSDLCGYTYRKVFKIGSFCDLVKLEICPHQCPGKQIVTSQRPIRLDELEGSSRAFPNLRLILAGVPLFTKSGEIMGAMLTLRNVTAEDELQKKYLERKAESITDGLTGLYNKSFTEDSLLRVVKTALRNNNTFALVMMDIDHFKKINDNYGHQTGDYILARVSEMLKAEVRGSDLVGRVGGEEFMAVLNNTNVAGACIFAERFRERVAKTEFVFEGKTIPVTMSFGTATFNEKWRKGLDPESSMKFMVTKADKALYYAKNSGRNRTCQYESLPKEAQ